VDVANFMILGDIFQIIQHTSTVHTQLRVAPQGQETPKHKAYILLF